MKKEKKTENEKPVKVKIKKKRSLFHKIVNVFLYFFLSLFILLVIAFGFTQTHTFREMLKGIIAENVNSSINGSFSIESIDGTIFTSLIINKAVLSDTTGKIVEVPRLEVYLSPVELLLKKIRLREVHLIEADINLIKKLNGKLNIAEVFTVDEKEEEDTTGGSFTFKVVLDQLVFDDVSFSMYTEGYTDRKPKYEFLNMDDLEINNMDMELDLAADFDEKVYELNLDELYFEPNIETLGFASLDGHFLLTDNSIILDDFDIETPQTDIQIHAYIRNINLFEEMNPDSLAQSSVLLDLSADRISFDDAAANAHSLGFLSGEGSLNINIGGSLAEAHINNLEFNYLKSVLKGSGTILNLAQPDKLYFDVNLNNSVIHQPDIAELMPGSDFPVYDMDPIYIDTLQYRGGTTNFNTKLHVRTNGGMLRADAHLDFRNVFKYKFTAFMKDLDLKPVLKYNLIVNSRKIAVEGTGINPATMDATATVDAQSTIVGNNSFDDLSLELNAEDGEISLECMVNAQTQSADITVDLFYNENDLPDYEMTAHIQNLDIGNFVKDSTLSTRINSVLSAEGSGFDPDSLKTDLNLEVYSSRYRGKIFTDFAMELSVIADSGDSKSINLESDIADVVINGKFKFADIGKLISYEAGEVAEIVKTKMNTYVPSETFLPDSIRFSEVHKNDLLLTPDSIPDFNVDYTIKVKELNTLRTFLPQSKVEADGTLKGKLTKDSSDVRFYAVADFKTLMLGSIRQPFSIYNTGVELDYRRKMFSDSLSSIEIELKSNISKLFTPGAGRTEGVSDFSLNSSFKDQQLAVNLDGRFNELFNSSVEMQSDLSKNEFVLNFDNLKMLYEDLELSNNKDFRIVFADGDLSLEDFNLNYKESSINLSGMISDEGSMNVTANIDKLQSSMINNVVLDSLLSIEGILSLDTKITGNFNSPVYDIVLSMDSIVYNGFQAGALESELYYSEQKLEADIRYLDFTGEKTIPRLNIYGTVPIDLSISSVEKRFPLDDEIYLLVGARDFDFGIFTQDIPYVYNLKGLLNSDITISGNYPYFKQTGELTITESSFTGKLNALRYGLNVDLRMNESRITLRKLSIENLDDLQNTGVLKGGGFVDLDGLKIRKAQLNLDGGLTLMSEKSKTVSPSFYGDLYISADKSVNRSANLISMFVNENQAQLFANIAVEDADLTFPPTQSAYSQNRDNFIYKIYEIKDTLVQGDGRSESVSRISINKRRSKKNQKKTETGFFKNIKINVNITDRAVLTYLFSRQTNERLTAYLQGELEYELTEEYENIEGSLRLLEESELSLLGLKKFQARGDITFDKELDNPYLDITAVYRSFITEGAEDETETEKEAAVKIKLVGKLEYILANLNEVVEENIAVYVGKENIEEDKPSPSYDKADAIWFILTGQLQSGDLALNDQGSGGNPLSGTATALAGNVLGGILNQYIGDYVGNIEIQSGGTGTKINLSGRYEGIKYSIGGGTDVFQDFSTATIRLEYSILKNLLLRLERRKATGEQSGQSEMVNELGLKYKFEF